MRDYQFFSVCLLRTPALSFKAYGEQKLAAILKETFFQDALLIASPILYRELEKADFNFDQLNHKQKNTVRKYFNRICFRPTPFGMFSSFAPVSWGDGEEISITKHDIHIASSFTDSVLAGRQLQQFLNKTNLNYNLNKTIYHCGSELRYLIALPKGDDKGLAFGIKAINNLPVLNDLSVFCAEKRHYREILGYLINDANIPSKTAGDFLDELIELQFLTDDLIPNITGTDYLERLITAGYPAQFLPIDKPASISITNTKLNLTDSNYIHNNSLACHSLYTNMEGKATGTLNTSHQQTILNALKCLGAINGQPKRLNNLDTFINAYEHKFGEQTIPLLQALDPETGVGYQNLAEHEQENELTSDIQWREAGTPAGATWSAVSSFLLKKWHEAMHEESTQAPEIVLTEDDLLAFNNDTNELITANTLAIIFRAMGNKVYIESAGGATATALIGRFTPFNQQITDLTQDIVALETTTNPDVIFAEITHICEFHTANINRRAVTYPYEIPILTTSVVDAAHQIPLSDLYISVIGKEIILFSLKHGKRVIPRLSSALNYTRNDLAVFQFLCDLQHQGVTTNLSLDLTHYFPGLTFYPRVEFQNAILSLATWRLTQADFKETLALSGAHRLAYFKKIKRRLKLPRWVAYTVHDHQLVFDLNDKHDLELLLDTISNTDNILLKEFLYPQRQDGLVNNGTNPLINQFITSVYHHEKVFNAIDFPAANQPEVARKLIPGSEWLYFKLYCHSARSNEIIAGHIQPMVDLLFTENCIDEWFFIRYADPDDHLRLRFKIRKDAFPRAIELISCNLGNLVKNQKASTYQIAIYDRELERYGHHLIADFERVFFHSSRLIAKFIQNNDELEQPLAPYNFGILTVREMLTCFNLTDEQRVNYLEQIFNSFFNEFKGDAHLKYQLDQKYRKLEKSIAADVLLEAASFKKLGLITLNNQFQQQLKQLYKTISNKSQVEINKWLADLVHMHLNRLFTDESRKQEFTLYYLLLKYEKSCMARARSQKLISA